MKFTTTAIFSAVLAAASVSASPQPATTKVPLTPSQKCLNQCPQNDDYVNCAAQCVGVPYPSSADTEDTRKCVAKCPQGDGSPSDTQKYAECSNECFKSYFYTSGIPLSPVTSGVPSSVTVPTTATASTTGSSGSKSTGKGSASTTSSSGGKGGSSSGKGGKSGSSSGGKSSTSSGLAPGALQVGTPVAGLAALIMGFFAL
jgi:cobalamin biosynthesis Mg chelatase CobN